MERHAIPSALGRREALRLGVGASLALAFGACAAPPSAPRVGTPTPGVESARKIVSDVMEFSLEPNGRWSGPFGSVTMKLHRGFFDSGELWFIRTDASDDRFARDEGLVHVPLLANALRAPGATGSIYLIAGVSDQAPVVTTVAGAADYTPALRVHNVTFRSAPELLRSERDILDAERAGRAVVEPTDVVVNYPQVKWPGGGLPNDPDLAEPLGKGPLIGAPDLSGGRVTFKLHQCFPASRYIVTDTSAVPMAPMMAVAGSAPTQKLRDVGATAPITIFLNGPKGPGVMGFQPAIFNATAGDPAWSPFWDHFAVRWRDPARAAVLRTQVELEQRVGAGDLERFNGVPETHPDGFVVNCPSPVVAPNTYTGSGGR